MHFFDVHGMRVSSDFLLPGLEPLSDGSSSASVSIREAGLPSGLESPEIDRRYYSVGSGEVLLSARGAGRLWIRGGKRIEYERAAGASDADLGAHILGSGLAAILHQRSIVVLHAASIVHEGKAFLICGRSGAGKSTTAAHLLGDTGKMLGDDVARIGDAPEYLVYPGPATTKLTSEALADLPHLHDAKNMGLCSSGKTIVSTRSSLSGGPAALGGIIVLETAEIDALAMCPLRGADAIAALKRHSFRKRFITAAGLPGLFLKWSALAKHISIWQVTRPIGQDTQSELIDLARQAMATMQNNGS